MSSTALPIVLSLTSAVTVALANLFVKRGGDVLSTRAVFSIAMGLCALPFVFIVPVPTGAVWGSLVLSVIAHWLYQFAMIRAMHRGDLSLVFPVMRGLAPLLTALFATVILHEAPNPVGWLGLFIASAALLVFALPDRDSKGGYRLQVEALIWAGLTAIGIGLYSVVDARGIRMALNPWTFVVWLFLLDWIGITVALVWIRRERVWQDVKPQLVGGLTGGAIGAVSYATALLAFTLTEAVSVTALRETSVVFGAILGAVFLKESFGVRRIIAATALALGLLLLEAGLQLT